MQKILMVVSLFFGMAIAYVDCGPNWDDTGVTAAAIFASCALLGALEPKQPWLWALAVGIWVPFLGIALSQNYGSLLALVPAFAGAYFGMTIRKVSTPA